MSRVMQLLTKSGAIFDKIIGSFFAVGVVLLISMMLLVSLDVFLRFFFNSPQVWIIEIIAYSLLFMTFLAAAWVLKEGRHVSVDFAVDRLKPRGKVLLNTITSAMSVVIWLVITWFTIHLVIVLIQSHVIMDTYLQVPKAPLVAIIPIGSFLLFIQSARKTYHQVRKLRALPE